MVVCKHWLRGLCKKGDDCEFLHKYDMERMPECYFYIKYGKFFPGKRKTKKTREQHAYYVHSYEKDLQNNGISFILM